MTRLNQWWAGAGKGKQAVFLIIVVVVTVTIVNAVVGHLHHSSSGGGSTSGFTANCFITSNNIGNTVFDYYPAVTFDNATSQDESVVGGSVTVLEFNQAGGQLATTTVNVPDAVIAPGQSVTSTSSYETAPTGTASCSVAPYQIQP